MLLNVIQPEPLTGKTFSLQYGSRDSNSYYSLVVNLADRLIAESQNAESLLKLIRKYSDKKRYLKKISRENLKKDGFSEIYNFLNDRLKDYTKQVSSHLKTLPLRQRFEKALTTTEQQYHLYMLEIELVNRINKKKFLSAEIKLAFLPHCLHDMEKDCLAKTDGIDYVCRRCSKNCYINKTTQLLKVHNIKAYIWRTANLKSLFKKLSVQYKTIGVLGIACIPELISGMRMCTKAEIPVVGMPLDANRCIRWMGKFYPTAVNLTALEKLIS